MSIAWHNEFYHRIDKHHPDVWHLFECLQREKLSFSEQLSKFIIDFQVGLNRKNCSIRGHINVL